MVLIRWGFRLVFWSIAGFILLGWALVMGMTFRWWLVAMLPVVALWVWMKRQGQTTGYKRVIIGLSLTTIAIITLYRGLTWERPKTPEGVNPEAMEYRTDDFVSFDIYDLDPATNRFVVFPPDSFNDIDLEIYLDGTQSSLNEFDVSNATTTFVCDGDCLPTPIQASWQPNATHTELVIGSVEEVYLPVVRFELDYPQLTQSRWYDVTTEATITYTDDVTGDNTTETVTRQTRLYAATEADKRARQMLIRWQTLDEVTTGFPTPIGHVVIAVLFGAVAFWGYRTESTFPSWTDVAARELGRAIKFDSFNPSEVISLNPPPVGVRIIHIQAGSSWAALNLEVGDVLMTVGEIPINNRADLERALTRYSKQDAIPVSVWRYGETLDQTLYLTQKAKR